MKWDSKRVYSFLFINISPKALNCRKKLYVATHTSFIILTSRKKNNALNWLSVELLMTAMLNGKELLTKKRLNCRNSVLQITKTPIKIGGLNLFKNNLVIVV